MRLGAYLRSGASIGWLAAGTHSIDSLSIFFLARALCLKKNQNAPRPSEYPPYFCRFYFVFWLVFVFMPSLELCRCSSDLFLSSRRRTVPDWQPRILLGMVEARSVNVKNTTQPLHIKCLKKKMNASRPSEHPPVRRKNVKTFRWDHRLQRKNLFMAFRVPRW